MRKSNKGPLRIISPDVSQEVVVKLKTTRAARSTLRALTGMEAPAGRAPKKGPLKKLLDSGRVVSMKPVFRDPAIRRATAVERMVLSVDDRTDKDLAGLNILAFDSTDEAEKAAKQLSADDSVAYAHQPQERFPAPARKRRARRKPKKVDPLQNRQWGLNAINLFAAQKARGFKDAVDIPIAVIDTGVDSAHPDLKRVVIDERSFTTGSLKDVQGHGTHVIGIIAAITNNGVGVSGTCQSKAVTSLKALGPYNAAGYYQALRYAADNGARVLNMSLGGGKDPTEERLLKRAMNNGVIVVAAMGNESTSAPSYPAAIRNVIAVGASTEVDGHASFSNTGSHINLVAPGVNILSTVPTYPAALADTTDYEAWPGTSMATPYVAAAVALMLAKNPAATLADITDALERSADKVPGQQGFSKLFGHGRLNVENALKRI